MTPLPQRNNMTVDLATEKKFAKLLVQGHCTITSADLINDNAVVVDYTFTRRNKSYLLSRVQYWKEFLRNKNVKRMIIMRHNSVDSIAIFYACLEIEVQIVVAPVDKDDFPHYVAQTDLAIADKNFLYWTQNSKYVDLANLSNLFLLTEKEISNEFDKKKYVYQPEIINFDFEIVNAYTSGTTGQPKKLIHQTKNLLTGISMAANLFSDTDIFASHCSTNHIGMVAVTLLGPLYAGSTLFTIQFIHELGLLAARGLFTKVFLYEKDLLYYRKGAKLELPHDCFQNCTVMSGGSPCSVHFITDVFNLGAKKFINLYGNNEGIMQQFYKEFGSPLDEILHADMGTGVTDVDFKICQGTLWIRSPSQGPHLEVDSEGFFNTQDYVEIKNNKVFYLGRTKYVTKNTQQVFDSQIKRAINVAMIMPVYYAELISDIDYQQELDQFEIRIFPMNHNAHDILKQSLLNIHDQVKKIIGKSSVNIVVDERLVDFNLAMTGIKPNVFNIKKNIESNIL